jgi:hypothetical protein
MTYLVSGTSKVIAMILKDEEIINKIAKERLAVVKIAAKMFLQQQLEEAQQAKKKLSQIRKGRVTDAKVVNDLMSYIGDLIPKAQAYEKRLKEIKQKKEERRLKKEQKQKCPSTDELNNTVGQINNNDDGEQEKDSQNIKDEQPEQQQPQEEQVSQEEVPQMKINEEQQQNDAATEEDNKQQNHDLDSNNNDSEGNQTNGKLSLTEDEKEYDLESLKSNSSYSTIHFLNDPEQESLYSRYTTIKNCADIALKQYSESMPQGLIPLIEFNYQLKTVYKPSKTNLTPEQQVTEKLNALTTMAANTTLDNVMHNNDTATLQFYDKQGRLLDSTITFDNISRDIKRATQKRQEAIKDIADKLKKLKRTAKNEKNPSLKQATTEEIDSIKKIKEGILKGGVYKISDSE